jgi:hypothetical protein
MRGLFIVVSAAVAFLIQVSADKTDKRAEKITTRIDKLMIRASSIDQQLNERLDPDRLRRGRSLKVRVDALAEPTCEDNEYQCGGDDPQCISNLFVCDGRPDCRNGEDEKHCGLPVKEGDVFIGDRLFDHCGLLNPDHMTLVINSVTIKPFFTSHPKIKATLKINVDGDDEVEHVTIPVVGLYDLATHRLVFAKPDGDGLSLAVQFDGHDPDRFVGDSVSPSTGQACSRFIYHRKH